MSQLQEIMQKLIQTDRAVNTVRRAVIAPELRSIDEVKRTIEFVSSTETPDRYSDVLKVSGWQTANYMKTGGVVLWAHKSDEPPIGKTLSIKTEANPPALVQLVEFADKATFPFADQIFKLYAAKFLRSVSVGFKPLAPPEMITDKDGNLTGGYTFKSMELIELSCVPCPANTDAVARAIESGIVTRDIATKVFVDEHSDLREEFEGRLAALEMEMSTLKGDVGRLLRSAGVTSLGDLEALLLKGE
jgi:uncharacterized protein